MAQEKTKTADPAVPVDPAPAKAIKPVAVGQVVLYRPNDRETYRARVTVVNPDNSVELVYTNPGGNDQTVVVPYRDDAMQSTVGPHWVEEPE
jgi:hypothetical protein